MATLPLRKAKLPALIGNDDRLRYSLVTLDNRRPVEQEPERIVGGILQPAFQNGWTSLAGKGRPRFWKTSDGWVHVAGVAYFPNTGGTFLAPIFTLPTGYRPPFEQVSGRFPAAILTPANLTAYGAPSVVGFVNIPAEGRTGAGEVSFDAAFVPAGTWVALFDGISFRAT